MDTDAQRLIASYIAAGQQTIAERVELQAMLDAFDQASPEHQRQAFERILALAIGASIKSRMHDPGMMDAIEAYLRERRTGS